jgi:hypothetical protein
MAHLKTEKKMQVCFISYLLPPLASARSTSNLPNQGKMMRFMYSKHGFPSTIARGQKAVFTSYPPGTAIIKFMQSLLT